MTFRMPKNSLQCAVSFVRQHVMQSSELFLNNLVIVKSRNIMGLQMVNLFVFLSLGCG